MIGHVEANITFGEIIGFCLLWLVICIVTLGIGLMFAPYAFSKFIINHIYIQQQGTRSRMRCELGIGGQLGHIIGWFVLVLLTLGLAFPIYTFKVWNICLNNTTIQP